MLGTNAVNRVWGHLATVDPSTARPARSLDGGRAARINAAAIAGAVAVALGLGLVPRALLAESVGAGIVAAAAILGGLLLLGAACRDALGGRHWWTKLLGVPVALVLIQWVFVPAVNVGLVTNAPHEHSPNAEALGLPGAREVSFPARDGVLLRGWFVVGESRATVIVLHGSHGNRSDVLDHVRMLNAHGYSVLAYDARGHGDSAGRTNALGWDGNDDLAGAIAFLRRQSNVDPRRVAALGLSMGA